MQKKTRAQRSAGKYLPEAGSDAQAMPLAYGINGFARAVGIGRTKLYEEISAGRLRALKAGKRTIITVEDGRAYVASLPAVR